MTQSAEQTNALEELARVIVDFLPGPGPGYPIVPASFQGIARELELSAHWQGFSKPQSVEALLEGTLSKNPEKFTTLLLKIIEVAREHHNTGKNALTAQDVGHIRACVKRMGLSISELEAPDFARGLPARAIASRPTQALNRAGVDLNSRMRKELVAATMAPPEEQGYALELFLNKLFANSDLSPRSPFRQRGQQITGVFNAGSLEVHLHAYWQPIVTEVELESIRAALPEAARCLVVSLRGYADEVKSYLQSGSTPNLIAADVRDIFLVLDGGANLDQMFALKARAAEKGKSLVPSEELLWG